ncbi:MAG: asparagine--tRNA ligase [Pantoea sp. Brub]|nr:asparagine--tRNA ligase [Pantoea sp. Brub]
MRVVSVLDILQGHVAVNDTITVRGWIRTRRDSKAGFSFISIYDGSCFDSIQSIANKSISNYQTQILHLTTGCSVVVIGKLVYSPNKKQMFEIQITELTVVGWVENANSYPITAKKHSMEYLRDMAHLRSRTSLIGAITRIRHTLIQSLHRFFHERGYFWIPTPIITSCDTEGCGKMFRVSTLDLENLPYNSTGKIDFNKDFFGKEAFLTVSGQLNAETYASSISKVYTFGPTFRAENSNTSRHLAEFWMLEPEVAFASIDDVAKIAELMLKYVFKSSIEERNKDMLYLSKYFKKDIINRLQHCIENDFIQIDYNEAINILSNCNKIFKTKVVWGMDLSSEHERYLVETYFKLPVIIKHYPKDIKAFYMRLNEDGKTVASMDILVSDIGEIIGGSQREERLNILDKRLNELGLKQDDYWWYRDLRRYGTVPHSGFGLGFERLTSFVTGTKNVKDTIPFPRTPYNLNF